MDKLKLLKLSENFDDDAISDDELYELENLLGGQFMRISKSTILNLDQIYAITKSISNCQIKFHDSYKTVYVSRRYYRDLNDRLKERRALS